MIKKFNLLTILFFFSVPLFSQTKTLWLSQNINSCTQGVVTVNVRTKNFRNIEVFQGSVNWDSTKLKYTGYTIPANTAYSMNSSNVNVSGNKFGFFWFDGTLLGTSAPDSSVVLTLNFNVVANATGTTTVMFGNKPTKQEIDTTDGNSSLAGIYKDTAFLGCIIKLSPFTQTINISGCNNAVYKGVVYYNSTLITDTIKSPGGCDSIYNLVNITINKITPANNSINLSSCNSVTYKNKVYTGSTIFIDTVKNVSGCDSIYNIVNIVIAKNITTNSNNLSGCNSVLYNGITYTNSTIRTDTIKNIGGCDSIYKVTTITVNKSNPVASNINLTGCNSVFYKGITYTSSTAFIDTIRSIQGCDSIYAAVIINVNKSTPTTGNISLSGCNNVFYKGIAYSASTVRTDTLRNINGCDSIYTIANITVNKVVPIVNNISFKGCSSAYYNGVTYTTTTILKDTVRSVQGCDSIFDITNILIGSASAITNTTNLSGCDSVVYKGVTYKSSTTRIDTIKTVAVSNQNAIYWHEGFNNNPGKLNTNSSDPSLVQGTVTTTYQQADSGTWVLYGAYRTTGSGCANYGAGHLRFLKYFDGTTIPWAVSPIVNNGISEIHFTPIIVGGTVGKRFSVLWTADTAATTTNWTYIIDSFTIKNSCVDTALLVNLPTARRIKFLDINGGTSGYQIDFDSVYIKRYNVNTGSQCDSIYNVVNINVNNITTTTFNINLTGCNSVMYKGIVYKNNILVKDTVRSYQGCDSIYNLVNITIVNLNPISNNTYLTGCNSVLYKGITYYSSKVLIDTVRSYQGCDSVYNIATINVVSPATKSVNLMGCRSVLYKGITYTSSTQIIDTIKSVQSCDSVYNVANISVYKSTASTTDTIKLSGCNNVVYKNVYYTTSTSFVDTVRSVTGCDSIYHGVMITIGNSNALTNTKNLSDCNSVLYNGITYTGSVVIKDTVRNKQGCDSIYNITNITIRKNATYAYITNSGSNTVSVINIADKSIVATIPVGNEPEGVSASSDGNTVYITNYAETTMNVIKTATNTVIATLNGQGSLQSNPGVCVSPDGSWLYLWGGGGIAIVNTSTNSISGSVSTTANGLGGICTSPDGSKVYVTNAYTNAVTIINALNKTIITSLSVGSLPFGICISPDSKNVYVANKGSNTVNVINTTNNTISATITVGSTPEGICVSPDGSKVYVTNYTSNTISVINTATNSIIATITVGTNPLGISITPDGSEVYVANYNGNTVSVINTANNTVTNTIAVGTKPYSFGNFIIQSSKPLNNTVNLSGCGSVLYKGISYTSSTVIKDTVKSIYGCDSIYIVINIAITKVTPINNPISLIGCNSVIYKNKTYTGSTAFIDTVKTGTGCDSIYNLVSITINKMNASVVTNNLSGCNSVLYNGVNYTGSTTFIDTVKSVSGCDSIYKVVNIAVTKLKPVTDSGYIHGCNSVFYNNKVYTNSVLLRDTLRGIQGCDSIYNITSITIYKLIALTDTVKLSGCNSAVYKGITYTNNINFTDTVRSISGCDSLYHQVWITLNKLTPVTNYIYTSGCDSFVHKNVVYYSGTTIIDTIRSVKGCDSIYNKIKIFINHMPQMTGISSNSPLMIGDTLKFSTQGGVFTGSDTILWTGPNGYSYSFSTYPYIANVTPAAGTYYSYTKSGSCVTPTFSTNVTVDGRISGSYVTASGKSINGVSLSLNGTPSTYNSNYSSIVNASAYTLLKASKNNDINKTNGVTTLDLALTQSHILGKNLFNSPYKIIAADVNGDGKVTTLDIVYMKRLILGIDTTFNNPTTSQKRLWAFVDSSYKFPDTTNPFPIKDSISYNGLTANKTNQTFIGCKLGDVNWDWNPSIAKTYLSNVNNIEFTYDAIKLLDANQVTIPIRVKNFKDILGLQFTISFNPSLLQWHGLSNNLLGIEMGTNHAEEGSISFLWLDKKNEIKTLDDGTVLFNLVFDRKGNCINEQLDLNSSVTAIAAYDKDYNIHGIVMNSAVINATDIVKETWTVAPNPVTNGVVQVQLNLKLYKKITLKLLDNNGKLLRNKEVEGIKGSSKFAFDFKEKLPSGVYYLQAIGLEGENMKKIVVN